MNVKNSLNDFGSDRKWEIMQIKKSVVGLSLVVQANDTLLDL